MANWTDCFESWMHPSAHAHPDSPAGAGGPGSSRPAGPELYWDPAHGIAHPDSPVGRNVVVPQQIQPQTIVASAAATEKLRMAVERAIPKLPIQIQAKVRAMLTPEAIATLTAIAAVWAGSQWIGVGEVVDVVLLGWGLYALGSEGLTAAKDLYDFATIAYRATTDQDIDHAASALASAIAIIGVDGLAVILAHKVFKQIKRPAGAPPGEPPGAGGESASELDQARDIDSPPKREKTTAAQGKKWNFGTHKSPQKWVSQMAKRGWTPEQIDEALASGDRFPASNDVNPGNPATRYVNPSTGRSVVVDDSTGELLHVGGDGFRY